MTVSQPPASSPSIKLVQTSLKVKRSGGRAVSGRIFLCGQRVFSPKTFPLSRLYNGRRRQRKQATDGKVDTKTTPKETAYSLYYITSLYAVLIFYNRRDIF